MRRIYVAGAGCAGLVSAACYARKGHLVSIYEKEQIKREIIVSMRAPFFEPNLDELLAQVMQDGRLQVAADAVSQAAAADLCIVTVGTPTLRDCSLDLSAVLAACHDIGRGFAKSSEYNVLAIRSTVSPGTTSGLVRRTVEQSSGKRAGRDFGLVVCPEFLRTGSAIRDMLHPDRVVIGASDDRSGDTFEQFVRGFYDENPRPVLRVSPTTAEIIKYASNAFLATKVGFMNEIANICELFEDVDVRQVAEGMGYDPRIGTALPKAGLGFGGPCLPKDLAAFAAGARRSGTRLRIAEATLTSNKLQNHNVIRLARKVLGGRLKGKRAAVLGLAFKPGTSDIRDSPAIKIVETLLDAGANVTAYDPAAMNNAAELFGKKIAYAKGILDCLEDADCCFILTAWDEFRTISSDQFIDAMNKPIVLDCNRTLEPSKLDQRITYAAIGLKKDEGTRSQRR